MTDSHYLPAFSGWLVALGEDVLSLANLLESPDVARPWRRVSAEALESLLRASELIPEGLEGLGYLEQAFILRLLARRALDGGAVEPDASEEEAFARGAGRSDVSEVLRGASDEAPEAFDTLEQVPAWSDADGLENGPAEPSADEPFEAAGALEPSDDAAEALEAPEVLHAREALEAAETPETLEPSFEAPPAEAVDELPEEPAAEAPLASDPEEVPARVARLAADAPLVEEFIGGDLPALLELAYVDTRRGRRAQDLLLDATLREDVLREARAWVEDYRAPVLADGAEELVKIRSFFRTRLLRAS